MVGVQILILEKNGGKSFKITAQYDKAFMSGSIKKITDKKTNLRYGENHLKNHT